MKLSIQIVHYRETKQLEEFLDSLFINPPSCSYEVIVVNNGQETEEFLNIMNRYQKLVRFIHSDRNLGYGAAHQIASHVSEGEYLAFCNCDLKCEKGAWDKLVAYLDSFPQVGIVGPQLVYQSGKIQESYRRFPGLIDISLKRLGYRGRRTKKFLMSDELLSHPFEADWLVGAVMVMPRRLYFRTGGFDPRFFLFLEDTDLCRTVRSYGYGVVYHPGSRFIHGQSRLSDAGSFLKTFFRKSFWWHLSSLGKYFWKWW